MESKTTTESSDRRFALLIDADNVSARYLKPILNELSKYGTVTIKRIYGDWTLTLHAKWKDALLENSITPIQQFGYTQGWLSRVMNSDAFQARLAARKTEVVDPQLVLSIDEKLRALASKSLDVVLDKLAVTQNPDTALKALEVTSKALGYGARQQNLNVQQNFVVALPPKAASAEEWVAAHGQGLPGGTSQALPPAFASSTPGHGQILDAEVVHVPG